MTRIYNNKKEALKGLQIETKAAKKYANLAFEKAMEGKRSSAINFLDIAQTAKKCADQAHEALWELSQGKLTEKEFEIFCEAETITLDINKAYQEIKR